jgi:AAA family ATP:ADP antiporter
MSSIPPHGHPGPTPITVRQKTALDRLLGVAAEVHAGEGLTALMLAVNGFLLLAAYYTIRPLRSALLLPVQIELPGGMVLSGPEIASYTGAIFAVLFLAIVPLYGSIASKVDRIRLINLVTLFFVVTLIVFFVMGQARTYPRVLGVTYFLWMGVFNLMIIAQFWSFANDLYTPEQGKRLFAIVGFGGSVGAGVGSLIASLLISRLGAMPMMLVGAGILLIAMLLSNLIHARDHRRPRSVEQAGPSPEEPLGAVGGFRLVLSQRYLLLIGLLTLTVNVVNTNGNYLLSDAVAQMARTVVATGNTGLTQGDVIGSYMAVIDFWQNLLSMAIQFFLVSRIFKYLGIGGALFVLPVLALGSYGLFALAPVLSLIRFTKIVENATDYSLQNTVRRALFLPTSREAKYKALQAVETFFWRAGDMMSAVTTFVVIQWLAMSVRGFAVVNFAVVVIWILLAVQLARENRRLMAQAERAAA